MCRVGFEPTTPVFERSKTVRTLDRATKVIGFYQHNLSKIRLLRRFINSISQFN
jgi:hypothetical protein